jgi:hypothetical protein
MKMASKSRRRTMVSWHLVEGGHASTWMMKMASVKSRRKMKVSSLMEVSIGWDDLEATLRRRDVELSACYSRATWRSRCAF